MRGRLKSGLLCGLLVAGGMPALILIPGPSMFVLPPHPTIPPTQTPRTTATPTMTTTASAAATGRPTRIANPPTATPAIRITIVPTLIDQTSQP